MHRAEFQGDLLQDKCDEYLDELRLQDDPEADLFDCTDKLWFHASDIKLWSISVYFIIVTLTTCASPPAFARCAPQARSEVVATAGAWRV